MKQNLSTRGQRRAGSGLAKVLMTLAIMLFAATGAWDNIGTVLPL